MINATLKRLVLVLPLLVPGGLLAADGLGVTREDGRLEISLNGQPLTTYTYRDPEISRPYFSNLHSPTGVRLTRRHPPVAGQDRMDHPDYHPGLWLAFGDLSGADNWRLKAAVRHERFTQQPSVQHGVLRWRLENQYLDSSGQQTLCRGDASYTLREAPQGVLLTWDTKLTSDAPFTFGDQEEMGLGLRMATPLRVEQGGPDPAPPGTGEIIDNQARKNAQQIWGKVCQWIDYRGQVQGAPAGVALFCHPDNPRPTRMHARDYGYVCANPFAIAAFDAGPPATVTVAPGEVFRLRYGVLLHSGQNLSQDELADAYDNYCKLTTD